MIFPSSAQATAVQLELKLQVNYGISKALLLAQSQALAEQQIRAALNQRSDIQQVRLYVFADYAGQSVPVLLIEVDRTEWQANPQIDRYSRVLDAGITLLGLEPSDRRSPVASRIVHTSIVRQPHENDVAFRDD